MVDLVIRELGAMISDVGSYAENALYNAALSVDVFLDLVHRHPLSTLLLLGGVLVLLTILLPSWNHWVVTRYHKTRVYRTNHGLGRDANVRPIPFANMPSVPKKAAKGWRKVFDIPEYLHQYVAMCHNLNGPVFRDDLGNEGVDLVFIADSASVRAVLAASGKVPGHVVPESWKAYLRINDKKRGLFFMEGDEWTKHRKILNKRMLRMSAIKPHVWAIGDATESLMEDLWTAQSQGCLKESLQSLLYRWSLECVCSYAFGKSMSEFECESEPDCGFERFVSSIQAIFDESVVLSKLPVDLAIQENVEPWVKFCDACDTALYIAGRYVSEAMSEDGGQECLLTHLTGGDGVNHEMATRLIADLLLAAADTTVMTSQWVLYLLGLNQRAVTEARNEIRQHRLSTAGVVHLSRCRNIVRETVRMYPVAPFVTRTLSKDCTIGGYQVPADTMAVLSVFSICRDPHYFRYPGHFVPERWNGEPLDDPSTEAEVNTFRCPVPQQEPSPSAASASGSSSGAASASAASASTSGAADTMDPPAAVEFYYPAPILGGRKAGTPITRGKAALAALPWGLGSRSCVGRTLAESMLTALVSHLVMKYDIKTRNPNIHMKMRMVSAPSEDLDIQLTKVTW